MRLRLPHAHAHHRRCATAGALAGCLALLPPLFGAPSAHADEAATASAATSAAATVQERVYVETETDTDHDGRPDRVALDIARPAGGGPVPVVFEQSPYRYGTNPADFHDVDVDRLPQEDVFDAADGKPGRSADGRTRIKQLPDLPGWYDDYFLPRGYAVVLGHSIGTGDSTGCPTTGDMNETTGTTAVIDWLNGRATAYDGDGQPVQADWSTGKVGMLGVSYNGTLPNMAAATGVEGLEAIVPISAISDWYGYYRANGLVVAPGGYQGEDADVLAEAVVGRSGCSDEIAGLTAHQDRVTGDYSDFWRARDYVRRAADVSAAVFVMHGQEDWNVKGGQYARWWEALRTHDVPRKIWLHNGGHGPPSRSDYRETIGRCSTNTSRAWTPASWTSPWPRCSWRTAVGTSTRTGRTRPPKTRSSIFRPTRPPLPAGSRPSRRRGMPGRRSPTRAAPGTPAHSSPPRTVRTARGSSTGRRGCSGT